MGEAGMAGSFLQTTAASSLRRFAMEKADLPDETQQELLSFLSGKDSEEYAPQSGQIVGILKEMDDEMTKSLGEATATEEAAIKTHETLIGDLGVEIAGMENDLEDTQQSLAEDKKFVAELAGTCEKKKKEWAEIEKVRAEELVALAETIKILNSDDALELFKKTLPSSASFMQKQVSSRSLRVEALKALSKVSHSRVAHLPARPELDLIALALRGRKIGFEKVIKMID